MRESEVKRYREEVASLKAQVDELNYTLRQRLLSDTALKEQPLVKNMESRIDFLAQSAKENERRLDEALAAQKSTVADKNQYRLEVERACAGERDALESEVKRIEADLLRVRHDRDKARRDYEILKKSHTTSKSVQDALDLQIQSYKVCFFTPNNCTSQTFRQHCRTK